MSFPKEFLFSVLLILIINISYWMFYNSESLILQILGVLFGPGSVGLLIAYGGSRLIGREE